MTTIYEPIYQITLNGFDISDTIKPYLLSIRIDDYFDSNFTSSQLDLIFHGNYRRNTSWRYKDQIQVKLWWKPHPDFVYTSPIFYVDYVEDIKESGGLQTYRISALEADPELGFKYDGDEIVYFNQTIKQAIDNFATTFNLNLSDNLTNDVYLGSVENYDNGNANVNQVEKRFKSFAEMIKYVCNTYGYFGNLTGRNLNIYRINSTFTTNNRFFTWNMPEIFNMNYKQSYNKLKRKYSTNFVDRDNNNTVTGVTLEPSMYESLNQKEQFVENDNAQYNIETASEILYAEMHKDFLDGFSTTLSMSALNDFKAGDVFLLNPTFGAAEGYYRCTRCSHQVDSKGWRAEIEGFPIKTLEYTKANFDVGYYGRTNIPNDPDKNFKLSQVIGGRTYVLGANKFDEYAKYVNPDYDLELGSIFLSEGNKGGNRVKPDLAFVIALASTNNFKDDTSLPRNNPFALGGLGVGNEIASFPDIATGIRAGIQHFFAYAWRANEYTQPQDPIVDPRYNFVTRGIAPNLDDLSGRWEARLDFGEIAKYHLVEFYKHAYPDWTVEIID